MAGGRIACSCGTTLNHATMESTAQYWRPVWVSLEGEFTLTLAQARSTRARRGRMCDSSNARRIAKRMLSGENNRNVVTARKEIQV